jgi:hypothetical protein
MILDKSKKSLLIIKIISCIIVNFLKLKDMYFDEKSNNIIDNIKSIKTLTKYGYDILTLNISSMVFNFFPVYRKLKKGLLFIRNYSKNIRISKLSTCNHIVL